MGLCPSFRETSTVSQGEGIDIEGEFAVSEGPLVVAYVSGHGFGHSTRMIEILRALCLARPDVRVDIRTTAPRSLYSEALPFSFDYRPVQLDVGVVQSDSLTVDPRATLQQYAALAANKQAVVDGEVRELRRLGPALVVADVPALAFDIAAELRLPGVAVANFSWDWIYEDYVQEMPEFEGLVAELRRSYGRADLLMRLPMTCPMTAFSRSIDVPLVARRSLRDPVDVRAALGLPSAAKLVLLSFGGMGVVLDSLPAARPGVIYVLTDSVRSVTLPPGYVSLPNRHLFEHGVAYEDLVAAVDVVMTKPGYGVVSECQANRTAMVYTSRGRFAEYPVLVDYVERNLPSSYLSPQDLRGGRWDQAIDEALSEPWPQTEVDADGASVIASRLLGYLGGAP